MYPNDHVHAVLVEPQHSVMPICCVSVLHAGSRVCPVTGQELVGWVLVESNVRLRARIRAWASEQGLNFDLLDSASALLVELREPLMERGGR